MALITCPDCGRDVSSLAPACPNCGRPMEKEEEAKQVTHFPKEGYICQACGVRGYPEMKTRGSWRITFFLLLCFIVPGILYSIWRQTSRYPVCPRCGAQGMIPINSPGGKQFFQKFGHTYTPPKEIRSEDTMAYKLGLAWATYWKGIVAGTALFFTFMMAYSFLMPSADDKKTESSSAAVGSPIQPRKKIEPFKPIPVVKKKESLTSITVRGKEIKVGDTFDHVLTILKKSDMIRQEVSSDSAGSPLLWKHYSVGEKKFVLTVARTDYPGPFRITKIKEDYK